MRKIERIFVHCTASSQKWGVKELLAEFKARGWKNPGYHRVVTEDGVVHHLLDFKDVSNGVYGYNATAINIAYVGGIDSKGKPVDNRTEAQKTTYKSMPPETATQAANRPASRPAFSPIHESKAPHLQPPDTDSQSENKGVILFSSRKYDSSHK